MWHLNLLVDRLQVAFILWRLRRESRGRARSVGEAPGARRAALRPITTTRQ